MTPQSAGEPLACLASRSFQKREIERLANEVLSEEERTIMESAIADKGCICHDLGGGATIKHDIDPNATPALCPGPSIAFFSGLHTLEEMVGHIYGRLSLLEGAELPHMFIRELMLYVDHLRHEVRQYSLGLSARNKRYLIEFRENLLSGVEYYKRKAEHLVEEGRERFFDSLESLHKTIDAIAIEPSA